MSDIRIRLEFPNYNSSQPDGLCFDDQDGKCISREGLNNLVMTALCSTEDMMSDGDRLVIEIHTDDKERLKRFKENREEREEKQVSRLVEERLASLLKERKQYAGMYGE